jgi:DNA repair protein RadD
MLREYQQRAIDQLYKWFADGNEGNPCLVLPTGSGKSHIIAALCKDALQNWPETVVLMLTHVKELIEQNAEKMRQHWPGAPMGIYSASIGKKQLGEPITFAGIQSVLTKSALLGHIDLVIVDECFVAGTKISTPHGLVDIDLLRCGDLVYNQSGLGEVQAISIKPSNDLYKLEFDDGTFTECTGGHPYFTEQGWKAARELENGSYFFSVEGMRLLWDGVQTLDQTVGQRENDFSHARGRMGKAAMLLSILFQEIKESDEQSSVALKNEGKIKRDQSQTYQARRQRAIITLGTACATSCFGGRVGGGVGDKNKDAEGQWLSNLLQAGSGESGADDGNRGGRWIAHDDREENSGQEKNRFSCFPRLVNISRVECESAKPVFNLHVSGHPSYFADGKLVHNCHLVNHKDEGGYRQFLADLKAINPALRVIGLTATPYRLGHGLITDKPALFDALIEPVSIEELIFKGYLSNLRSKMTLAKLDTTGVHKRGGEFIESELQAAVDTYDQNQRVVAEVIALGKERKSWLFFCAGVKHAQHVSDVLNERGIIAECVTGETSKPERERMLKEFKLGRIRALTNANVLTTGFDAPGIDLIAMLRPTMSASLYVQMAGRGMRVADGKTDCLVLDFAGVVATHGPITNVQPPKKGGDGNGEAPVKVCDHCGELVHISAMVCPACGTPFPEPVKKKLALRGDDIMGLEGNDLEVTSWVWRKHISRASGKMMLSCTYYGGLSDKPITEYLPVLHEGYAGERALQQLFNMANSAGAHLAQSEHMSDTEGLDYFSLQMSNSKPPSTIEYKMDGKFHRVIKRSWA